MAFAGLSNRAQMVGGEDPFYLKVSAKMTYPAPAKKRRRQSIFAPSTSAVTPSKTVHASLIL